MSDLSPSLRPAPGYSEILHRAARAWPGLERLSCSVETCIVAASVFFTLFANQQFWHAWAANHESSRIESWAMAAVAAILITALHALILGLVLTRRSAKPVLAVLFVVTALAAHYMNRYTVFLDASMIRNILHTDFAEARELMSFGMVRDVLLYGALPALLVSRIDLRQRSFRRAAMVRALFLLAAMLVAGVALLVAFQHLSSLMRNHKEMRYLVTPANLIVSSLRVAAAETEEAKAPRIPVGMDAVVVKPAGGKPRLLVVVVGETARAANWGLDGYQRQTTPELAATAVVNFSHVNACGTNTEVSVPCMFSPFGRKSYDEKRIRRHESVLHVLEHAGIKTIWRDNQSGCKGVCERLETQRPADSRDPAFCGGEHCLDEILLAGLETEIDKYPRDLVIVLHQIGNHGPAYSQRYPDAFRRFTPTCDDPDLAKCSREQIVNSYDNALLYTDHFLAQTIRRLQAQQTHEAAMIYVSDHGESLGENGIYLHGFPYAIAPREQTEVPMLMWMSRGFVNDSDIDMACLRQRARHPASHDHLFHSILGLMQVHTSAYDFAWDLVAGCRTRTDADT